MDYSPPDSSVHVILQAKIVVWVAILFSRGSSQSRAEPESPTAPDHKRIHLGSPNPRWLSVKESAGQCKRCRKCSFNSYIRKIPWRRKWQPTPVFLPRKIPWTQEPGGPKSIGLQRARHNWVCMKCTNRRVGAARGGGTPGKLNLRNSVQKNWPALIKNVKSMKVRMRLDHHRLAETKKWQLNAIWHPEPGKETNKFCSLVNNSVSAWHSWVWSLYCGW